MKIQNVPDLDQQQRAFSRRAWLLGSIGGLSIVGAGSLHSYFLEPRRPRIDRVDVPIASLPLPMQGFSIAHLSDLHCGPFFTETDIRRGVDLALSLVPDLIVLTGDFVSRSARYITGCARELSRLQARHGVLAVLGNHDHWTGGADMITHELRNAGVQVLTNEATRVVVEGVELWMIGVDDIWCGQQDLARALHTVPDGTTRILLAHEPDFADEASRYDIALQLSGHSHGGQVRIPGKGPLVLPPHGRKYPIGLQRVDNSHTWVYTNRGLGCVFPPIRINCPPEVTLLRLVRSSAR